MGIFCVLACTKLQAESLPISLDFIIEKTLQKNSQILAASFNVKVAKTAVEVSKGVYSDPVVSLASSYSQVGSAWTHSGAITLPNENALTLKSGITQYGGFYGTPVEAYIQGQYSFLGYDGMARALRREIAELTVSQAEANYQFVCSSIMAQVVSAYWDWVSDDQKEKINQQLQINYERLGDQIQRLVSLQERASADLDPILAEAKLHAANVFQQRHETESSRALVFAYAGEELSSEMVPSTPFPLPTQGPAATDSETVLASRNDYKGLVLELKKSEKAVQSYAWEGLPQFNLFAQADQTVSDPTSTPQWRAGISLDFTVFNHVAQAQDNLARAAVRLQKDLLTQQKASILNEEKLARNSLDQAVQAYASLKLGREFLEKSVQNEERKLANGIGAITDILQLKLRFESALDRELETASIVAKNLVQYGHVSGQLMDTKTGRPKPEWIVRPPQWNSCFVSKPSRP